MRNYERINQLATSNSSYERQLEITDIFDRQMPTVDVCFLLDDSNRVLFTGSCYKDGTVRYWQAVYDPRLAETDRLLPVTALELISDELDKGELLDEQHQLVAFLCKECQ